MRIVFLYREVMGYTLATLRSLTEYGAEIHVVHWDHVKLTPYKVTPVPDVAFYQRSKFSLSSLRALVSKVNPDILVISGWRDPAYLRIGLQLRSSGVPVVVGLDGQWTGSLKQRLLSFTSNFGLLRLFFSHAWVAGVYQFEYARKFGFKKTEILQDLYCADIKLFEKSYLPPEPSKRFPRRLLFVGRLEPVKGLRLLARAWHAIQPSANGWELCVIGNGSLRSELKNIPGILCKDFLQPHELAIEFKKSSFFIIPSVEEPWGVVVHEACSAGVPILTSDTVGSASTFVISGFNGFHFRSDDLNDLILKLRKVFSLSQSELVKMGENSYFLSRRITPQTSAKNLLSLLC